LLVRKIKNKRTPMKKKLMKSNESGTMLDHIRSTVEVCATITNEE
jgi:hypothetical protein